MRRLPASARLGGLVAAIACAFAVVALSGSLSAEKVRDWVDGVGIAGPLAFVVVAAALGCAFFPGPLLAGAAGLLFGTALGTPVAICSAVLSAVLACTISRRLAGDAIETLGGRRVKALARVVERRGFLAVLYVRLAPGVPYTLFNYAVGLTKVPLATFAAATALGTAPRTFAYVALGGSFGDLTKPETLVAVGILVAMGAGGLVGATRGRAPSRVRQATGGR